MTARKKVRRATLAPVRPPVLAEPDAAAYVAKSQSWMRKRRADDLAAIRRGKEPTGPAWIQIENSIAYRVADLDEWLAAKSIEFGSCEFRGHRAAATTTDDATPTETETHDD